MSSSNIILKEGMLQLPKLKSYTILLGPNSNTE